MMNIESERLLLKRPAKADWSTIAQWMKDPIAMQFLGGARSDEKIQHAKSFIDAQWNSCGYGYYAVFQKTTNELVGVVGLGRVEFEGRMVDDLGYLIAPEHWGKGIATEASALAIQIAHEQYGVCYVIAWPYHQHRQSRHVAEKLNFQYVKTIDRSLNGVDHTEMALYELKL